MPAPSLSRLLSPKSVAVIGGRVAESVAHELIKLGFEGDIWPINPKRQDMAGLPCFASLEDLPHAPDAAYIGIGREAAIDAVATLKTMSAGGAVIHAAGFEELGEDGGKLSARLIEAANDMPVIGPNCWGMLNLMDKAALWPDFHGCMPVSKGIAILSQSGNMAINMTMQARALPLAMMITIGNQTVTNTNDIIETLLEDDRITAIGLHTEGIPDIARFSELACAAHAKGKPIVVLKTGASEKGAQATMTHTATLSGADAMYDALFARTGVARVHSVPTFLETLKLLTMVPPLPTGRITSLSCSGGEASLMADAVETRKNLSLPDLSEAETKAVRASLNEFVEVTNPLDYHTFIWANYEAMKACYAAMMQVNADIACLIYDIPRADRADTSQYDIGLDAWIDAHNETGARACVIATLPECLPEETALRLQKAGIVPLFGLDEALDALNASAKIASAQPGPIVQAVTTGSEPETLSEQQSKSLLAEHGLRVPKSTTCPIVDAGKTTESIGFPVAIKSTGIAHKTEAGGVALNITTADEAQAVANAMSSITENVLVEEMIAPGVCELIIGITRDPQFGLALVIGAGGTLTELLKDSVTLLLPSTRYDIKTALMSLKVSSLITGFRGQKGDLDATLDAIMAIASFATKHESELEELDVNPLIVQQSGQGAIAADALIRMRKPS